VINPKERVKRMEYDVKSNFLVLAKYFGLLGVLWYVMKRSVPFILKRVEQVGAFLATRVHVKSYTIIVIECLFLFCLAFLSNLCFMFERNYMLLIILFLYGATAGSFVRHARNNNSQLVSLIEWTKRKINLNNYYINCFKLICDQLPDFVCLWASAVVTLQVFRLPWPGEFYYAGFLILPIYLNVWIYCTSGFRMQTDGAVIFGRKWIAYAIMTFLTLYNGFVNYQAVVLGNKVIMVDAIGLFSILITLGVFGALERFLKFWNDDYRSYSPSTH
jgi:hypothetical protein